MKNRNGKHQSQSIHPHHVSMHTLCIAEHDGTSGVMGNAAVGCWLGPKKNLITIIITIITIVVVVVVVVVVVDYYLLLFLLSLRHPLAVG